MDIKINTKNTENRPGRLLVVCILSWINIGFYAVITLFQLFSGPVSEKKIQENIIANKGAVLELRNAGMHVLGDLYEKWGHIIDVLNQHHYKVQFLTLAGLTLGIIGVSFMFLGRKLGFHLYIIYSLYSLGQLYLFFSPSEIPSVMTYYEIGIAGVFIALYASCLKWMR